MPTWGKNNLRIPVTWACPPRATNAHVSVPCPDIGSQDGGNACAGLLFAVNFASLAHAHACVMFIELGGWALVSIEESIQRTCVCDSLS